MHPIPLCRRNVRENGQLALPGGLYVKRGDFLFDRLTTARGTRRPFFIMLRYGHGHFKLILTFLAGVFIRWHKNLLIQTSTDNSTYIKINAKP